MAYSLSKTLRTLCVSMLFVLSLGFVHAVTLVGKGTSSTTPDGNLRIVFPLNERTSFTSFRLDSPPRLVVDIPQAQLRQKVQALAIKGKNVSGVRLGTQQGTDLRIVVDLVKSVPGSTALVKGKKGYELVILVSQGGTAVSKDRAIVRGSESVVSSQSSVQVAKQVPKKNMIVVIDPGHGGKDPGAIGAGKTKEKDVVLAIGKALRDRINRESGMRAVMTRDSDRFIPLRERVLIARRQKADMFVSIHADAALNRSAWGASVYILSTKGASSEAARLLAEKENRSDIVAGVKMSDKDNAIASMLLDISQDATIEASNELGKQILGYLQHDTKLHKQNVERANFAVLKAPDIPSVLVETGFISNANDEKKLRTASHQKRLADDMMKGIRAYFKKRPATELVYSTVSAPQKVTPTVPMGKPMITATPNPPKVNSGTSAPRVNLESQSQVVFPALELEARENPRSVAQSNQRVQQGKQHTVLRGESLDDVAKRYKVSADNLRRANGLPANQLRVPVGTVLRIP